MDSRLKKLKLNSILSLIYQFLLIISGLILPKFFLKTYGSDVYGLISSITQFLSFINICDMGITAVVSSALYKPLAEKNDFLVSKIVATSRRFFKILSFIFIAYIVVLLCSYPFVVDDSFDFLYTVALIAAMSISTFGQYFIGATYQLLINADQKSYVQITINGITLILNTIISIVLMTCGCNVQIVKLVSSLIYIARPLFMWLYVKRHYKIDTKQPADWSVIPQRTNGVIQHLSYTVYENTDVVVLTIFSSLSNVAVYTVYYLITNSLKSIISALTVSIIPTFGDIIAKGEKETLNRTYNIYEWFLNAVSTLLFSIAFVLILEFVSIYTKDINDANYNVPLFACLIIIATFLSCIRVGMFNLIKSAGHYKQTQKASLIEAIINVVVSIVLVFKFGLVGVAIGTIGSTAFFICYEVFYLSKHILERKVINFIKQICIDILSTAVIIFSTLWINVNSDSYLGWIISALIVSGIALVECIVVQLIFNRKTLFDFFKFVIHK